MAERDTTTTTAETRTSSTLSQTCFLFFVSIDEQNKSKKTGTEEVAQQVQLNLQLPHLSMENVSYVKTIKEKMGGKY